MRQETPNSEHTTGATAAGPSEGWPPRFLERAVLGVYRTGTWLAAPAAAAWFAVSTRRRVHLERFRPAIPAFPSRPIWLHACSVGEVTAALPLARSLLDRWPRACLLVTVSTPTGFALARDQSPLPVAWFPLDHPLTVRGFFDRLRPSALILVETELWPLVLATAHARRIPVALVSGRLSDGRAKAYRATSTLWRPLVRPLAAAAMQTEAYTGRIAELGLDRRRISVTGNIKYDAVPAFSGPGERAALRTALGIAPDAPLLVCGSTREGDEALAAQCFVRLRDRVLGLRMIIAPRHLDRVDAARRALSGVPHALRSALGAGTPAGGAPVILLDTHGELRSVYGLATIAVVCGSFYPGVNGHNPIEPAAQGVCTVFGPYMRNFGDIAAQLLSRDGAVQVQSAESLCETMESLLNDTPRRDEIAAAGLEVIQSNQGAIARTLDYIAPIIDRTLGQ